MYNRYIPQPDGTYRKNRVAEPVKAQAHPNNTKKDPPCEIPVQVPPVVCSPPACEPVQRPCHKKSQHNPDSVTGFFKQLLPKDLDTADLLIILLLLLIAGDCEEDRNNALLTLALYFFL